MESIRNIAIIAHVDHGKTTLVDKIMYHCQLFRDNENAGDLILDNNDLERERGITTTLKMFRYTKERKSTLLILLVTPISVVK
jgi:GTP-binding protein